MRIKKHLGVASAFGILLGLMAGSAHAGIDFEIPNNAVFCASVSTNESMLVSCDGRMIFDSENKK